MSQDHAVRTKEEIVARRAVDTQTREPRVELAAAYFDAGRFEECVVAELLQGLELPRFPRLFHGREVVDEAG
jgi:hypothetical protein